MASNTEPILIPAKKRKHEPCVIDWQCINPQCNTTFKTSLTSARRFVQEYFAVTFDPKRKRKVCAACNELANKASEDMVDKLKAEKNWFTHHSFPIPKEVVTLDDSDPDLVDDESDESEYEVPLADEKQTNGAETTTFEALTVAFLHDKLGISGEIEKAITEIRNELEKQDISCNETDQHFDQLGKDFDNLRHELYSHFKPNLKVVATLDLNNFTESFKTIEGKRNGQVSSTKNGEIRNAEDLPPVGPLIRDDVPVNSLVFAINGSILRPWQPCTVVGKAYDGTVKLRYDEYDSRGRLVGANVKSLEKKYIAYSGKANVRVPVGTRVVTVYRDERNGSGRADFHVGIVAELPKIMNKFRYLIFFDDGFSSYVDHDDIRVVMYQSPEVWHDVHPNCRKFIQRYLSKYPERAMVKLVVGQDVQLEFQGMWCPTKVTAVDASIVTLKFLKKDRIEDIYRGSTRLRPLHNELVLKETAKKKNQDTDGGHLTRKAPMAKNSPYIAYTRQDSEASKSSSDSSHNHIKKNTARKSSIARRNEQIREPFINFERKGETSTVQVDMVKGKPYIAHDCSPECMDSPDLVFDEVLLKKKNVSPLLVPIVLGWKREITKSKSLNKRKVLYVAPCGRRLRNMKELHKFLLMTKSNLEIDFFNFDWFLHVMNEFKPVRDSCNIPDLSYGKENVPVPCVNALDKSHPEYVEYSSVRIPQKDVHINTDPGFLVCCDCTDGCANKDKCACIQLTIQNTTVLQPDNIPDKSAGYSYRRLLQQVPTGIFECNSQCKCAQTCLNRVAQKPLRNRLQVFKTLKRGWGIRTLCDLPAGAFVCIYVGYLYSNAESNNVGKDFGDEYFAELDMVEGIEQCKEGYESEVENLSDVGDLSPFNEQMSEDSMEETSSYTPANRTMRTRDKKSLKENDLEESDASLEEETKSHKKTGTKKGLKPTRKYFGEDEEVYVMDAKSKGNIGRYLNHSCDPNVFVQNCFVDTHDIRFPWLAFFTSRFVTAGQELCWDYNYVVDQVEGKEIYCACGADECRERLL